MSFRKPHTIQEIKAGEALMLDPDIIELIGRRIVVRPKRFKGLPTDWDDLQHSTKYHDNSWKRHRLTQCRDTFKCLQLT